ncbi:CU044_5270 family protein [Phytomonospora endophytica]|uniref:CU044_5270 family protein n=1 Tax=Phytomonospora endophytica TaxID=714109 RepID=A0A841FFU1_9ACTN|nr:CU044_5270 family protein [Phytomonospora endophytica]MBB6034724.1 hypothetical protein [Phytomonospora endophytica]GIG69073.1 hypothetical protein Pen01_53680 [Phytomonospora endophytica]
MTNEHDDHDELARLLPDPAIRDLSAHRHRQIQEFLMTEFQPEARPVRRPRRRFALVTASVLAAAAVAVGAATGGFGLLAGGDGTAPDTAATQQYPDETPAARTFRLAAQYAAAQPWTDPRPDQWLYIKSSGSNPGPMAESKGMSKEGTDEVWLRADGVQMAAYNELHGKIEAWDQDNEYPFLSTLPTDPQQLLDALLAKLEQGADGAEDVQSPVGEDNPGLGRYVLSILDNNLLPPDVTSALWQAAALIPGAVVEGPTEIEGREVLTLGFVEDGWWSHQVLVDPATHEYVGFREIAVADGTYEESDISMKKGEVESIFFRDASGVVDGFGLTP